MTTYLSLNGIWDHPSSLFDNFLAIRWLLGKNLMPWLISFISTFFCKNSPVCMVHPDIHSYGHALDHVIAKSNPHNDRFASDIPVTTKSDHWLLSFNFTSTLTPSNALTRTIPQNHHCLRPTGPTIFTVQYPSSLSIVTHPGQHGSYVLGCLFS